LAILKTIRFGTFRNIEDEGDNIDIIDYIPALNGRTKSLKIILEGKNNIIVIKKNRPRSVKSY
jgi:hypothetical protein